MKKNDQRTRNSFLDKYGGFYLYDLKKDRNKCYYTRFMFYIFERGNVSPEPPCLSQWLHPVLYPVITSGDLIYIAVTAQAITPDVSKGLRWGGGVMGLDWSGDLTKRLPEQVEPGAVFPLRALDFDLVCRNPPTPPQPLRYIGGDHLLQES